MYYFWNFGQYSSFMPKYGKFQNWSVSRKPLPIEQKQLLGLLPVAKFMPKYGNFENSPISRKPLELLSMAKIGSQAESPSPWVSCSFPTKVSLTMASDSHHKGY